MKNVNNKVKAQLKMIRKIIASENTKRVNNVKKTKKHARTCDKVFIV